MKRSRKPHITSERTFGGHRWWYARNRGSKTYYVGTTPSEALRQLIEGLGVTQSK